MNQANNLQWNYTNVLQYNPHIDDCWTFYTMFQNIGPTIQGKHNEMECFKLIINKNLVEYIIQESSTFIERQYETQNKTIKDYNKSTVPYCYLKYGIKEQDIYALIGIRIYSGLVKILRKYDYWNKSSFYYSPLISDFRCTE